MTRSTELCEISRSCQRAIFSIAASELARTTRASPQSVRSRRDCACEASRSCRAARRQTALPLRELRCAADGGFRAPALERCRDDRERGKILRVTVALDYLRGDRRGGQAEALADFLLDLRAEVRARADGAGNFSHGHLARGGVEARGVAPIFRVPVRNFQAEGDRLGMDAVRAADFGRVLEFPGALFEHFAEIARCPFRSACEASRTSSACAVSTTSLEVSP